MATLKVLNNSTGGLSQTSKMPGKSWSIDTGKCFNPKWAACRICYARKGMYRFPVVAAALKRRYEAWAEDPAKWAQAMADTINKKGLEYFRWFDSGDLVNHGMLNSIVWIARQTPNTKHWLPTKQYRIIRRHTGILPANLTVRLSAPNIGTKLNFAGMPVAGVNVPSYFQCLAPKQGGECKDCRACWDKNVKAVSYAKH